MENKEKLFYYINLNLIFEKIRNHYLKSINYNNYINVNFYYNGEKINPNTILRELKLEPFSIIIRKEEI